MLQPSLSLAAESLFCATLVLPVLGLSDSFGEFLRFFAPALLLAALFGPFLSFLGEAELGLGAVTVIVAALVLLSWE